MKTGTTELIIKLDMLRRIIADAESFRQKTLRELEKVSTYVDQLRHELRQLNDEIERASK